MSYSDFRVTYIPNRFGAPNSILVPSRKVVIDNDNGTDVPHLFNTEEQRFNFEIYGQEYMFGGEVCIPGEWNYCYHNGKFFHLEKTKSNGFTDDQEGFFYTLIYDDGQNDWLNNNVRLMGTINLTGDKELVKQNLLQTRPLITNVNNFRIYNGIVGKEHFNTVLKLPDKEYKRKGIKPIGISSYDTVRINELLKTLRLGEPDRNKLVIPFLYRTSPQYHWKFNIINSFTRMMDKGVAVFDVAIDGDFRKTLENTLKTPEIYTVSSLENKTYTYARSVVQSKYVTEIDLSRTNDLIELDPISLTPKYSSLESAPKFELKNVITKMINRLGWSNNLQVDMENVFTDIFTKGLGNIFNSDTSRPTQVFKNLTVEPIKRDLEWFYPKDNLSFKNPSWIDKVWDEYMFNEKAACLKNLIVGVKNCDNIPIDIGISNSIFELIDASEVGNDIYKAFENYFNRFRVTAEGRVDVVDRDDPNYGQGYQHTGTSVNIRYGKGTQLILPVHKYKLVSESGAIDFTREEGIANTYVGLLPDYERNTHVLAVNVPLQQYDNQRDIWNLRFATDDTENPMRGEPVIPFSMFELYNVRETETTNRKGLYEQYYKDLDSSVRDVTKGYPLLTIAEGTFVTMYKTGHSRCDNKAFCDYTGIRSEGNQSPNGYMSGKSQFLLGQVRKEGDDGIQYQVEFTFPFNQIILNRLENQCTDGPDCIIRGEVVGGKKKGQINRNFRTWKNGKCVRVSDDEKRKYDKDAIIAVGINPNNHTNGLHNLESAGVINAQTRRRAFNLYNNVRDPVYDNLDKYYNHKSSSVLGLFKFLHSMWFNTPSDGFIPTNQFNAILGGIPTRLVNETARDNNLRSYGGGPQMSMTYVKPYQGINYICHFKFHPTYDEQGYRFGSTTFNFHRSKDGFIVIIPEDYSNASKVIPTYTYRQTLGSITRDAEIAFMFWSTAVTNSKYSTKFQNGHITWSNNHGQGGGISSRLKENMSKGLNQENIYYEEYIKKSIKSGRTDNPNKIENEYIFQHNGTQSFKIYALDTEIPQFIVKYLDPDSPLCDPLHSGKTSKSTTDVDRIQEWKERIERLVKYIIQMISTTHTWFKLEGTDGYTCTKLNVEGDEPRGDSELFTSNSTLIKTKQGQEGNFRGTLHDDVDALINSTTELVIYGRRIPQKTRYFPDETGLITTNLIVQPLEDPKQSEAASWYYVELKNAQQDVIRDILEIPKELVRRTDINIYERERLIREVSLKSKERESEALMHHYEKSQFHAQHAFEGVDNAREFAYRTAMGAADVAFGTSKALAGQFDGRFGKVGFNEKTIGGLEQAGKGAINMADAAVDYGNKEANRGVRYSIGTGKLEAKGELMNVKHNTSRANEVDRIGQMSCRVQYPQTNNGIIYKIFNKTMEITDVHMVQYYPSGELLDYIKRYYREYGYDILVRDFRCSGIMDIQRHLRYINIFDNTYDHIRVKQLIEARALNGIFVTETEPYG